MNCAALTFPAVKVTMGRKIMLSLASGIFEQTAASTAMTAPDCGTNAAASHNCPSLVLSFKSDFSKYLTAPNDG